MICSSPNESSNPNDYIAAHPSEYDILVNNYAEYTLNYCFEQFLQEDQTDLRGDIMASACKDIAKDIESWVVLETLTPFANGQEWFNQFRSFAEVYAKKYSTDELAENFPVTWILIQQIEEMSKWELLEK